MTTKRYIAYYRVSTERQGKSGLGLEAQQQAVLTFLNGGAWELVEEFTEVETGKRDVARPELQKALDACKRLKATLVIAKLDRLSRSVSFISTLMDAGVPFVCCDNPHATKLTLHILAAVAEHERETIAERTRVALAVAKRRGTKSGRPIGNPELASAQARGHNTMRQDATRFAANVLPIIREIDPDNTLSNAAIAAKLNERKVATRRGGTWTHVQVGAVLARTA